VIGQNDPVGIGSAPASGAVFLALAENTGTHRNVSRVREHVARKDAGREARPATPEAGVLPNFEVRDKLH
jgi:hypothetical protein